MLDYKETILRLLIAALAGSIIGIDRERLQWTAGLRTHMLVCVGSCLVIIVSAYGFSDVLGEHIVLDPSRVAAQVVSGIGFLGAGTILLRGEVIKGLTTAASLWAVAAIGLAVGSGLYTAAVATTTIVLIILAGIKPVEEHIRNRVQAQQIIVTTKRGELSVVTLHELIGPSAGRIKQFVLLQDAADETDSIRITFSRLPRDALERVAATIRAQPYVIKAELV